MVYGFKVFLCNTDNLHTIIWFQAFQLVIWFQVTNNDKKYFVDKYSHS